MGMAIDGGPDGCWEPASGDASAFFVPAKLEADGDKSEGIRLPVT